MAQLAKAVGVTHRTIGKWLKRSDFPLQREAPWSDDDVAEIKMWRQTNLQPNRADPQYQGRVMEPPQADQTKDYWLMRKYRAQALEQEGKLLDTDEVMRAWTQTQAEARDQWLLLAASAQGLLGLNDEQTKQLDEFVRQTLDSIADRMEHLADSAATVPSGSESIPAIEAPETEPMGGGLAEDAPVDDSGTRAMEE